MTITSQLYPIETFTPHPQNYNEHPDQQLAALEEGVDQFSQYKNIVVWSPAEEIDLGDGRKLYPDTKYILAGHGLWLAMRRTGATHIEAKDMTGLSYEEALALLEWDNASTQGARPNPELLARIQERTKGLLADRPNMAWALQAHRAAAGVSENGRKGEDAGPPVDRAEQLQEKWQVKAGDIWQLGRHRLTCGDCRDIEAVKAVCDGQKVNGVFTSPPYAEQRKKQYGGVPTAEYVEWWEAVQGNVREVLAGDGSFFVNIKPHCEDGQRVLYVFDLVLAMVREWGWRFVEELCWVRNGVPKNIQERFRNAFEPIYHFAGNINIKMIPEAVKQPPSDVTLKRLDFAVRSGEVTEGRQYSKGGFSRDWATTQSMRDGVYPDNVLRFSAEVNPDIKHAAAFPLALPTFFIKAYSDPDDIWLDPFAGSGTTLIACENEGRIGRGIEILPKYCAVALQRWADLTGGQPELIEG